MVAIAADSSNTVRAFQTGGQHYFNTIRHHRRQTKSNPLFVSSASPISLKDYLEAEVGKGYLDSGLSDVLVAIARSCAEVSARLQTHSLENYNASAKTSVNVQGEEQKGMDVVANNVFLENLLSIPEVYALASEEEESVVYGNTNGRFEVAFDPLDGSGNLDVNLPTGSIFGIAYGSDYHYEEDFSKPGSELRAAGYALYSSSTELVVSLGQSRGVAGFTLDPSKQQHQGEDAFVLSRPRIVCPASGPYYSLNEAREPDWPDGLKRWIRDAKLRGYSARYVCSLCADFHRTLLQGGWAGNPRPHLRLLYEAAPLAFVAQAAGGMGSDGLCDILSIEPQTLHDRIPVFLGSSQEITDLVENYGNVQQVEAKRYDA